MAKLKKEEKKEQEVKLQNSETGEDVNLTLSELRDVARGKAVMMMKEVQTLNENNLLLKREIPEKFIQCFQCLAEVLILEERIFAELVNLCGEGTSTGLFDQFKEFATSLTGEKENSAENEPTTLSDEPLIENAPLIENEPLNNETVKTEVSGVSVEVTSEVKENGN